MSAIALSLLSGILLTLAFPKTEWWLLAFLALIPLFKAISGKNPRRAFLLGFITGLTHFVSLIYWVYHVMGYYGGLSPAVSVLVLLLFTSVLALFIGCFCLTLAWLERKGSHLFPAAPLLWVTFEWVRSHIFTGFPWELLGYSMYRRLAFIQAADIVGVYGISFVLVSVNVALFLLLFSDRPWKKRLVSGEVISAVVMVALLLVYGQTRLEWIEAESASASKVHIGMAQGNIEQDRKWLKEYQSGTLDIYEALTAEAVQRGATLVVWPETAAPFYFDRDKLLTDRLRSIARNHETHLLVGAPAISWDSRGRVRLFNRALLLDGSGNTLNRYDKSHLVPYGEYVPLKKWFSFLGKLVEQVGDFSSGEPGGILSYDDIRLGPLICFESIFPYLARKAHLNGAQILVNITNDAWFGRSSAAYQHFSMLTFRSVETRSFSVRAANTGISGVIHASGKVLMTTTLFEEMVIDAEVPILTIDTFYARYGDFFAFCCIIGIVVLGVRAYIGARQQGGTKHVFGSKK
ncbi:MAG: apolipoprotein N-acyltransferase [Deltaproteobacteria bacterium]|nr:apolipoprotein N-acyltransferase [Deltaproteobacteria bacterium]